MKAYKCGMKAYKYRIYPNKTVAKRIDETLITCRFLYNDLLAERKAAWEEREESISVYDQQKRIKEAKKTNEYLPKVYSQVLTDVARRLDKSYQAFFRRLKNGEKPGYPKFKSARFYTSFTYPQHGFWLEGHHLRMSKMGTVRVKLHRPVEGKIKTLTVLTKNGKYYAIFSCEVEPEQYPITGKDVGIDVGIKNFVATSDGEMIESLRVYREAEKKLKHLHKSVSRKKKGGYRRKQAVLLLAKQEEKVANTRKDVINKVAYRLLTHYDTIYHEDLNIRGMLKNRHLAKSITDAAWGKLFSTLKGKADMIDGKEVVGVNPRNTSQRCSQCLVIVPKPLHVRRHLCPHCGADMDRDVNAAKNILSLGRMELPLNLSMSGSAEKAGDRQDDQKDLNAGPVRAFVDAGGQRATADETRRPHSCDDSAPPTGFK